MGSRLVTAEDIQGLEEVKPLRIGASPAPDNNKRQRVTEKEFKKVAGQLGSVVADMLRLVWCTGMRPNEVCSMRPYDILRDDDECWLYIPGRDHSPVGKHKTMRFDRVQVIPLAKECQNILKTRIQEQIQKKSEQRKTPLSCGNKP